MSYGKAPPRLHLVPPNSSSSKKRVISVLSPRVVTRFFLEGLICGYQIIRAAVRIALPAHLSGRSSQLITLRACQLGKLPEVQLR